MTETAAAAPALPAAGSSFYLGMRVLPGPQRRAMYAVYAFCRAVDDIADDGGARPDRVAGLDAWRRDIDALFGGEIRPSTADLAPFVERFRLPRQPFHDVIDGMEMDAAADIQAPDWATLDLYCDRVASAVGRLSARIFGLPPATADHLAQHLGRALQLTNILRDLDEDAERDRLYLPREPMLLGGMTDLSPKAVLAHPALPSVCADVARRAEAHYGQANAIMAAEPRRLVKAPRLMGIAYRSILDRLLLRGFEAPRARVRTDKLGLLLAALRYGIV